jgi:hypothetical protein
MSSAVLIIAGTSASSKSACVICGAASNFFINPGINDLLWAIGGS